MTELSSNSYQKGPAITRLSDGTGKTTVPEDALYKLALQVLLAEIDKTYPFEQPPVGTPALKAGQVDREPDFFTPESGQEGLPQPLSAGKAEPTLGDAGLAVVGKVAFAVVRQALANAEPETNPEPVHVDRLGDDPNNSFLPASPEQTNTNTSVGEQNVSVGGPGSSVIDPYSSAGEPGSSVIDPYSSTGFPGSSSFAPYSVGSLIVGR